MSRVCSCLSMGDKFSTKLKTKQKFNHDPVFAYHKHSHTETSGKKTLSLPWLKHVFMRSDACVSALRTCIRWKYYFILRRFDFDFLLLTANYNAAPYRSRMFHCRSVFGLSVVLVPRVHTFIWFLKNYWFNSEIGRDFGLLDNLFEKLFQIIIRFYIDVIEEM